ncbi:MAG: hypothetical protein ACFBSD_03665 [Paracoccaceae bacterium]
MTRSLATLALLATVLTVTPLWAAAQAPAASRPAPGVEAAPGDARLAVEEAELRERLITALAIAESVRLRGRTILVAFSEYGRVRERIDRLGPTSERRVEYEARLAKLERRLVALDLEVDEEFNAYLEIVSELAGNLWSRLDRVGDAVAEDLKARRLARLHQIYPLVKAHIEEFHRAERVTRGMIDRWRAELDDTYRKRLELRSAPPPPEPSVTAPDKKKEDI